MNIVITGASHGLGGAIAEAFAKDGAPHTFFLCARRKKELEEAVSRLQPLSPNIAFYTYSCDVSRKEEVIAFAQFILEKSNGIDVLVNNAGVFVPGAIALGEEGALETLMQTNLYSAYHLTRKLLPAMTANRKGHIFNVCSTASLAAYKAGALYSISKFALMGFSQNLREEMKPHGVKVTAVFPGAFMSESWAGSGIDALRIMEAADVATLIHAAAYLSPQACVEDIVVRPQQGDV